MSRLVFRLRSVPDDEAHGVRSLFDAHGIDWFETTAGTWGIAMPGLWVERDADVARARELIDAYQHERTARLRGERQARLDAGLEPRFSDRLREHPFAVIGILAFCGFIVYAMLSPFVRMAGLAG